MPGYFYPSLSVPGVSPSVLASPSTTALLSLYLVPIQCSSLLVSAKAFSWGAYPSSDASSSLLGS